jgi:putative ABC transport system substrate-binding protein
MIDRRKFCRFFVGGASALTTLCEAQSVAKVYRLGELDLGRPEDVLHTPPLEADPFTIELARLGLVHGVNLTIDYRSAHGNPAKLDAVAAELVAAKPDLLYTDSGFLAARALKNATTTIPVVFNAVGEPVASGLVASLTRPGGNLTGGIIPAELELKRIQILMEALDPSASIAQLTTPLSEKRKASILGALTSFRAAQAARFRFVEVKGSDDLAPAFEKMARDKVGGVAIAHSVLTGTYVLEITALALKHRLPAIAAAPFFTDNGLMMSYAVDWAEVARTAANYAYRILKGAPPGDLPIAQITKFDFVINLKMASALGVRIPKSILIRANRLID